MTNETPETPEARKAREKAEAAAKKAAEAARKEADRLAKVREGKLKERLGLIAQRREAQEEARAINDRYKGKVKQFTKPEELRLNSLGDLIARLNSQIAKINEELGE